MGEGPNEAGPIIKMEQGTGHPGPSPHPYGTHGMPGTVEDTLVNTKQYKRGLLSWSVDSRVGKKAVNKEKICKLVTDCNAFYEENKERDELEDRNLPLFKE